MAKAHSSSSFITPRGKLPYDVTATDILKAMAVIFMVIDHFGLLFFPDIEGLRAIGRLSAPIWFFLIGYSDNRAVPDRWLYGAVIVAVGQLACGFSPLPLNVLFTLALCRILVKPACDYVLERPVGMWMLVGLLFFFYFGSRFVLDYGTMGFLLACAGYVMHKRTRVSAVLGSTMPGRFVFVVLMAYALTQIFVFGFSLPACLFISTGLLVGFFVLDGFRRRTYIGTRNAFYAPVLRFFGRYTLEIYVGHLLIMFAVFAFMRALDMIGG